MAPTVLGALRASSRAGFRIAHYSIQANHLHLIVEASNSETLSSCMRRLGVRLARRINRLLFRRGRLWVDRWHGVELTSPREVRNALVYVLQNHAKHNPAPHVALDPLSSAAIFGGFAPARHGTARAGPSVADGGSAAQTWLLRVGWKRYGLIRPEGVPAG